MNSIVKNLMNDLLTLGPILLVRILLRINFSVDRVRFWNQSYDFLLVWWCNCKSWRSNTWRWGFSFLAIKFWNSPCPNRSRSPIWWKGWVVVSCLKNISGCAPLKLSTVKPALSCFHSFEQGGKTEFLGAIILLDDEGLDEGGDTDSWGFYIIKWNLPETLFNSSSILVWAISPAFSILASSILLLSSRSSMPTSSGLPENMPVL